MEFETLKKIIAEVLSLDPDEITEDSSFQDDLGADSLDLYQVIIAIEEQFDIKIDESVAESITTVGQAAELIKEALDN